MNSVNPTLRELGLRVFERGWLSSNNILCLDPQGDSSSQTALVDTGYATHATQTLALVQHGLAAAGRLTLHQLVNTHLHSDHCGGNALLQASYPSIQTHVPLECLHVVQAWDTQRLSFDSTGQRCERFQAQHAMVSGESIRLGARDWQIHAAQGHDPTAVMLFEPHARVLISADALWESRLAIIFPELEGADGFGPCAATLDHIEALDPKLVIPGHGAPFDDVASALRASRERLAKFRADPEAHVHHARKALVMFHMLEHQVREEASLKRWLLSAPVMSSGPDSRRLPWDEAAAQACLDALVKSQVLDRIKHTDGWYLKTRN